MTWRVRLPHRSRAQLARVSRGVALRRRHEHAGPPLDQPRATTSPLSRRAHFSARCVGARLSGAEPSAQCHVLLRSFFHCSRLLLFSEYQLRPLCESSSGSVRHTLCGTVSLAVSTTGIEELRFRQATKFARVRRAMCCVAHVSPSYEGLHLLMY